MDIPRPAFVYIGRRSCGCCTAVISDLPGFEKDTAKEVAEVIASGRTIERVAFDVYRDRVSHEETFMACPHQEQKLQLDGLIGGQYGRLE